MTFHSIQALKKRKKVKMKKETFVNVNGFLSYLSLCLSLLPCVGIFPPSVFNRERETASCPGDISLRQRCCTFFFMEHLQESRRDIYFYIILSAWKNAKRETKIQYRAPYSHSHRRNKGKPFKCKKQKGSLFITLTFIIWAIKEKTYCSDSTVRIAPLYTLLSKQ